MVCRNGFFLTRTTYVYTYNSSMELYACQWMAVFFSAVTSYIIILYYHFLRWPRKIDCQLFMYIKIRQHRNKSNHYHFGGIVFLFQTRSDRQADKSIYLATFLLITCVCVCVITKSQKLLRNFGKETCMHAHTFRHVYTRGG